MIKYFEATLRRTLFWNCEKKNLVCILHRRNVKFLPSNEIFSACLPVT